MRINQFLIAVCVGTMLTACSSKDDFSAESTKHPLKITAGIKGMLTRSYSESTAEDLQNVGFIEGAEISVCPHGEHTDEVIAGDGFVPGSYVTYTKGATGWTTSTNLYVLGSAQNIGAYGVHPAKDASGNQLTWETTSFRVQENQTTDDKYRKSDLMFGTSQYALPTEPVELDFYHVMSKINIIVEDYSEVYTQDEFETGTSTSGFSSAYVFNVQKNATISEGYGQKRATGTGSTDQIYVCDYSSVDAICGSGVSCIIPPQTIAAGTEFIGIYVDTDNCFSYIVPASGLEFKGGYEYTFRLTLKKAAFSLSNITISPWQKESNDPISGDAK